MSKILMLKTALFCGIFFICCREFVVAQDKPVYVYTRSGGQYAGMLISHENDPPGAQSVRFRFDCTLSAALPPPKKIIVKTANDARTYSIRPVSASTDNPAMKRYAFSIRLKQADDFKLHPVTGFILSGNNYRLAMGMAGARNPFAD